MSRAAWISTLILTLPTSLALAADAGFSFDDKQGENLTVLLDGKPVARYMYAYDKSTPARLHETYKPYLHVFDADGKALITKGPGGEYTHHRGIFIGWMKITHNGKTYDRWHMKGGDIVHQKFTDRKAERDGAVFTSLTNWNDSDGKPMIEEERTMLIRRAAAPGRLIIDFTSKIKAVGSDITLDGDPEHSGIQFRPANELSRKDTTYVFPREGAKPHQDVDYPWVGMTFTLDGKKHSVVEMSHPDNPKQTKWSAYRDYGRFGAFPKVDIKSGATQAFKYRFLIADGDMPATAAIQKSWDEYAGAKSATPEPKTSVIPAERPKGK